jgi:hypothetical protein
VDDIVFGGSSNSPVARFAEHICKEFEMRMIGELQFFLGLQVKQSNEGTFVHQAKYTKDIVRKFEMEDSNAMATPMSTITALGADEEGEHADQKEYRSMIGSLLSLTVTRLDIQFSVCLCAHFQASLRTSHRQWSSAFSGICITLPTSAFGTPRHFLWCFMVFHTWILSGVG